MEITDMKRHALAALLALAIAASADQPKPAKVEFIEFTIRPRWDNHVILEVKCNSTSTWTIWAATNVAGPYDVKLAAGTGKSFPLEHPTLYPQRFFRLELAANNP